MKTRNDVINEQHIVAEQEKEHVLLICSIDEIMGSPHLRAVMGW